MSFSPFSSLYPVFGNAQAVKALAASPKLTARPLQQRMFLPSRQVQQARTPMVGPVRSAGAGAVQPPSSDSTPFDK